MSQYTGLRERTPYRMIFDAGAFYVNINEAELRSTGIAAALSTSWTWQGNTVVPTALGATRGGASFDPGKEERQIEVNNLRVPLIGLNRVDRYEPMISVTLLEMADLTTMQMAMGQSTVTRSTSDFDEITPKIDIETTDYFGNVALLAATAEDGQTKPAIVVVRNAKVTENSAFNFEDPGELATEVSFKGHALPSDAFTVPCAVYLPVPADGLGS